MSCNLGAGVDLGLGEAVVMVVDEGGGGGDLAGDMMEGGRVAGMRRKGLTR